MQCIRPLFRPVAERLEKKLKSVKVIDRQLYVSVLFSLFDLIEKTRRIWLQSSNVSQGCARVAEVSRELIEQRVRGRRVRLCRFLYIDSNILGPIAGVGVSVPRNYRVGRPGVERLAA